MFITATIATIVIVIPTHAGSSCTPTNGNVKWWIQTPNMHGIDAASDLPAELLPPAQAAEVVDRADRRRDRGAEQDPAHLAAERQERERRDDDPEEERDAAEPRHGAGARPARALGAVDDAEQARHPAHGRRQQDDHDERDERAPHDLEVAGQLVPDHGRAYFVPYRRSPASPRPGTM